MNISRQNIIGICNLKCNLVFKYPTSSCTASNYGNLIRLTYDNGTTPPVKYNNADYNVQDVSIVSPSRHLYNGEQVIGEFYINHVSTAGAPGLTICIPIMEGSISDKMLEDIITQVSTGAANAGENTSIRTDYNLTNIVPVKPFFNYNSANKEWVVFGMADSLKLNSTSISTLKTLITALPTIMNGPNIYVNTTGPNRSASDGQIYIDCQPTGSSDETTNVEDDKDVPDITFSLDDLLKNPILIYLLGGLIFFLLILGFNKIVGMISGTSKMPSSSRPSKKTVIPKEIRVSE